MRRGVVGKVRGGEHGGEREERCGRKGKRGEREEGVGER